MGSCLSIIQHQTFDFVQSQVYHMLPLSCHQLLPVAANTIDMPVMQEVDLSNNELTGTLPASLDLVQDLRLLDLSNNSLSGPLPTLFSADHMVVRHMDNDSRNLTACVHTLMTCTAEKSTDAQVQHLFSLDTAACLIVRSLQQKCLCCGKMLTQQSGQ